MNSCLASSSCSRGHFSLVKQQPHAGLIAFITPGNHFPLLAVPHKPQAQLLAHPKAPRAPNLALDSYECPQHL